MSDEVTANSESISHFQKNQNSTILEVFSNQIKPFEDNIQVVAGMKHKLETLEGDVNRLVQFEQKFDNEIKPFEENMLVVAGMKHKLETLEGDMDGLDLLEQKFNNDIKPFEDNLHTLDKWPLALTFIHGYW